MIDNRSFGQIFTAITDNCSSLNTITRMYMYTNTTWPIVQYTLDTTVFIETTDLHIKMNSNWTVAGANLK